MIASHPIEVGEAVRVLRTGEVGRIQAIDADWAKLFPHKGPLLVLEIPAERCCYSLCEVEPVHVH